MRARPVGLEPAGVIILPRTVLRIEPSLPSRDPALCFDRIRLLVDGPERLLQCVDCVGHLDSAERRRLAFARRRKPQTLIVVMDVDPGEYDFS